MSGIEVAGMTLVWTHGAVTKRVQRLCGVASRMDWRYRRHHHVLYVTAEYITRDGEYVLGWRQPEDANHVLRFPTLAGLYDYLNILETQLGADGWELLPLDQRAPNRLRTPLCAACPIDRHVDVTIRTRTHVHFRCSGCGYTWKVPKPGRSLKP